MSRLLMATSFVGGLTAGRGRAPVGILVLSLGRASHKEADESYVRIHQATPEAEWASSSDPSMRLGISCDVQTRWTPQFLP